jgi:hypothetical protein
MCVLNSFLLDGKVARLAKSKEEDQKIELVVSAC